MQSMSMLSRNGGRGGDRRPQKLSNYAPSPVKPHSKQLLAPAFRISERFGTASEFKFESKNQKFTHPIGFETARIGVDNDFST